MKHKKLSSYACSFCATLERLFFFCIKIYDSGDVQMNGHWEEYEEREIDPAVQAFITKCQNLMLVIGRLAERAQEQKLKAQEAISDCKNSTNIQTEDLSGIYYDEHYVPYRETFITDAEALIEECEGCLAEAQERIDTLNSLIAAKMPYLYHMVTKTRWVEG